MTDTKESEPLTGERLFDMMAEHSQKIFLDPDEPNPSLPVGMFYAVERSGKINLLQCPWANEMEKSIILRMVNQFFLKNDVIMYGLAQETWSVLRTAKDRLTDDRQPSQCDDRQEHIFYAVVEKGKNPIARRQEIIRPWDGGHPTLGPIEDLPFDSMKGRMLELMEPPALVREIQRTAHDG